jgi:hypothetical protein
LGEGSGARGRVSAVRLAAGPAVFSLAVTLLRLAGERLHWSPRFFSTETGGIQPSGMSWLVGITWLAVPFGVTFALRVASAGRGPERASRALGVSLLAAVFVLVALRLVLPLVPLPFPSILVLVWTAMALGAVVAARAWPSLARVLLVYGLLSRIPVVVVMFLAMAGDWGTHYDYVGMPPPFQMPFWPRFLWLALFPQLVFWVGFTIVLGTLAGTLALALVGRRRDQPAPAPA